MTLKPYKTLYKEIALFDYNNLIEIESIPGNAYKNKQKIIIKNDVDKDIAKFIKDYLK